MKPTAALRSFLLASSILAASPALHAAARWWDGTTPGGDAGGGTGTWTQTGNNWSTASTGGTQTAYSSGTTSQQAAFAGTAGTVTVSGTVYVSGASATAAGTAALNAAANYAFDGTGTIQLGAASYIHTPSTVTFGSGLTINKNAQALTFTNGGIVDALVSGSGTFAKGGGGTLSLNHAANSFSGDIDLNQGMIIATTLKANGANSSLGSGSIVNIGAAVADQTTTLRYDGTGGTNGTTNRTINLGGSFTYTAALIQNGTGLLTYSGNISSTTNFAKTLSLSGSTAGTGEISGNINNGTNVVSLTKTGTGEWTLSGTNGYSGSTTITGGKLSIASAGTINSTSGVTIGTASTSATTEFNYNSSTALTKPVSFATGSTGGTLSGNGTINLAVNVTTGNTLAIGDTVGVMNFGNNLEIGGTCLFELNNTDNTADLGDVSGNLTLGGTLDLVQLGAYAAGDKFTLFAYDGVLSGLFKDSGGITDIPDDTNFTDAGGIWQINYNDTTAGLNGGSGTQYVTITAIPEPAATLLGGLGMLALLRRRRH